MSRAPQASLNTQRCRRCFHRVGRKKNKRQPSPWEQGQGHPPGDLRTCDYATPLPVLPKHLPPPTPETPGVDKWAGHLSQDKFWEGLCGQLLPSGIFQAQFDRECNLVTRRSQCWRKIVVRVPCRLLALLSTAQGHHRETPLVSNLSLRRGWVKPESLAER